LYEINNNVYKSVKKSIIWKGLRKKLIFKFWKKGDKIKQVSMWQLTI
jgi:hypothetical protein